MVEENNTIRENKSSHPAPSLREQIMRELRALFNTRTNRRAPDTPPAPAPQVDHTIFKVFSPEDRDYYLTIYGFDPVAGRIPLPGEQGFKYETTFPLLNDPSLHQAGVTIGASVEVTPNNPPRNRIIFMREEKQALVNCVHTAICELPAGEAMKFPDTILEVKNKSNLPLEQVMSIEKRPLILPPEEHFASLKSYVAGIAEMGLTNVLCAAYHSDAVNPTTLPFGFNNQMQNQIARALREIAPESTKILVQNVLVELARGVPLDWIKARVDLLNGMYDFERAVFTNPVAFEAVYAAAPNPALYHIAVHFQSTHPDIIYRAILERDEDILAEVSKQWILGNPHAYSFIPDPVACIRAFIAAHRLTSPGVLAELASDPVMTVRKTVARHGNTPLPTLEGLARDEDASVRVAVESREDLTPRVRLRLHEGTFFQEDLPRKYNGVTLSGSEAQALGEFERMTGREIPSLNRLPNGVDGFVIRSGHVRNLRITEKLLQSIPPAIQALTMLEVLDLSRNHLTTLPFELAHIRRLKMLDISMNELTTKPAFFHSWVTHLQTSGCKINLAQRYASRFLTAIPESPLKDVSHEVENFPIVHPEEDGEPTSMRANLFDEMRLRLQLKLNHKIG